MHVCVYVCVCYSIVVNKCEFLFLFFERDGNFLKVTKIQERIHLSGGVNVVLAFDWRPADMTALNKGIISKVQLSAK